MNDRIMFWYVFRVVPGEEIRAAEELERIGMETVCPILLEYKRGKKAKEKRERKVGLFRGYVIAGAPVIYWMALADMYRHPGPAVLGVCEIGGGGPTRLTQHVVDRLKQRKWFEVPSDPFEIGENVRVLQGPFYGQVGIISSMREGRAKMLVNMLGQAVSVETSIQNLEAA
jgi:transcription antitermination factor NusG